jgi:hypothetical protein
MGAARPSPVARYCASISVSIQSLKVWRAFMDVRRRVTRSSTAFSAPVVLSRANQRALGGVGEARSTRAIAVCTENSNPDVAVMKSVQKGV